MNGENQAVRTTRIMTLLAETSLHPGTGQSTGVVDLPVQREKHTHFPMIQSSGVKGSLRDLAEQKMINEWFSKDKLSDDILELLLKCGAIVCNDAEKRACFVGIEDKEELHNAMNGTGIVKRDSVIEMWDGVDAKKRTAEDAIEIIFGPNIQKSDTGAGALAITDARILAFPVRSLQNVFVWVTCPMVLERLKRDINLAALSIDIPDVPTPGKDSCIVSSPDGFVDTLVLEELSLTKENRSIETIAKKISELCPKPAENEIKDRLVLVGDEDFSHLVSYATQVSARIKLNENKVTTGGGLWYEETLPPETLMYSLLLANPPRIRNGATKDVYKINNAHSVIKTVEDNVLGDGYIQIGGNETVGQGWCAVKVS